MKRWSGVRAVSFDVGGTLIEPWPSVGHVYATVAQECGQSGFEAQWLEARFRSAWKGKTGFDYSRAAWAEIVLHTFGGTPEQCGAESVLFQRLYDRFTEGDAWRIYDDVGPVLEHLSRSGLQLAVISNWDDRLRPLLANLRLDRFFSVIEVSGETGCHKPCREIFDRAVQRLGLPSDSVLHVGDSRVEDVEGARAAGLKSVLLRRGREVAEGEEALGSLAPLLSVAELS